MRRFRRRADDKKALPMLASACPGMASVPAAIRNAAAAQKCMFYLQDYSHCTHLGVKAAVRHQNQSDLPLALLPVLNWGWKWLLMSTKLNQTPLLGFGENGQSEGLLNF